MRIILAIIACNFTAAFSNAQSQNVLDGLRQFYKKTAKPDGSFTPGIDPDYIGMSDCAYSDLAAVTYACTVHKTFGWKLPYEKKTIEWLQSRQHKEGWFFNIKGTVDPNSPQGKVYNTTQALVALHALGAKPKYPPLSIFEQIAKGDHKTLPPYSTSFFPLAYRCVGKAIPEKVDQAIRATMIQDEDGYLNSHIAATYHASHYYQLVGESTPKSQEMIKRTLKEQKANGSWLCNMPSRDRHATFDAVFVLKHEGHDREDCKQAIARAAKWALSCRNPDGGFGHFPGSTSDADAIYFHIGTLVMANTLKPIDPLPKNPELLSWGHLMPVVTETDRENVKKLKVSSWVSDIAVSPRQGQKYDFVVAAGKKVHLIYPMGSVFKQHVPLEDIHEDIVTSVSLPISGKGLVTGSYDKTVKVWNSFSDLLENKPKHVLKAHRGAVMTVAYSPDSKTIASGSFDTTIRLWSAESGKEFAILRGHKSWVNKLVFHPNGKQLFSASSDGTVRKWNLTKFELMKTLNVSKAEVRSLAISSDGQWLAAGIRYGKIKVWETRNWQEHLNFQGHHGDVWSLSFSPDDRQIASGNGDWNSPGKVKIWQVTDGQLLKRFQHTGEVLSVRFHPFRNQLVAGGGESSVMIWSEISKKDVGK